MQVLEKIFQLLEEVIRLVKNEIGLVVEIKEPGTENRIIEKDRRK